MVKSLQSDKTANWHVKLRAIQCQVVRYTLALLKQMEQLYLLSCANGFGALPLELLEMKLFQPLSDYNHAQTK